MDPIANMIVAIKNGYLAKKEQAILPYSKFKFEVAKALEKEGYVEKVAKEGNINSAMLLELLKAYDATGKSYIESLPLELAVIAIFTKSVV